MTPSQQLSLDDARTPDPVPSGLTTAAYTGLSLDVGRKAFSADGVIALIGRMAEIGRASCRERV